MPFLKISVTKTRFNIINFTFIEQKTTNHWIKLFLIKTLKITKQDLLSIFSVWTKKLIIGLNYSEIVTLGII